jgi:hypothetical protein
MYVSSQELPLDTSALTGLAGSLGNLGSALGGGQSGGLSALLRGDDVTRLLPPQMQDTADDVLGAAGGALQAASNPIGTLLGGIGSLLSQLANYLGGGCSADGTAGTGEARYANATASSTGDPHLAFDGTTQNGTSANAKWDDMTSHADLLDSDSFAGGYRVSTTATAPNANGITYNASATVATNGGNTRVSLDAKGNATLLESGRSVNIADGRTLDLGNGESVARAQDGSLTVTDRNRNGGSITTMLRENGSGGVDVNATAQNVDLGGYLAGANGTNAAAAQTLPAWRPSFAQRHPQERGYDFNNAFDGIDAMD